DRRCSGRLSAVLAQAPRAEHHHRATTRRAALPYPLPARPTVDQLPPRPLPTGANSSRSTTPQRHPLHLAGRSRDQLRDDERPHNSGPRRAEPGLSVLVIAGRHVPHVVLVVGRRPTIPGDAERAGKDATGSIVLGTWTP